MSFLTTKKVTNAPSGSAARLALEFANANLALDLNATLSAAGTTTATTTSKAKTVNTLTYLSAGLYKSKAATDNFFTLGTAGQSTTTVPASYFQKYLCCIDPTGSAPAVFEGTASPVGLSSVTWPGPAWASVAGFGSWAPLLYILNQGYSIVSVISVTVASTTTFVPGTTLFGAAGITTAFADGIDQAIFPLASNEIGNIVGLTG